MELSDKQYWTIRNALTTAQAKWKEDELNFRRTAEAGGIENFMTADAAQRLADQFKLQQEEIDEILDVFDENDEVVLRS